MKRKVALLAFVSLLLFSTMFEAQFVEAKSWTTTEVVSTESTRTSVGPSLAVDSSDRLHVAWDDLTDYAGAGTDRDIFYKRFEVSPPPPPVGGIWITPNKLQLLAPWIALATTIISAIAVTAALLKHRKKQ